jgi:hypothetical protein
MEQVGRQVADRRAGQGGPTVRRVLPQQRAEQQAVGGPEQRDVADLAGQQDVEAGHQEVADPERERVRHGARAIVRQPHRSFPVRLARDQATGAG